MEYREFKSHSINVQSEQNKNRFKTVEYNEAGACF